MGKENNLQATTKTKMPVVEPEKPQSSWRGVRTLEQKNKRGKSGRNPGNRTPKAKKKTMKDGRRKAGEHGQKKGRTRKEFKKPQGTVRKNQV